MGETLLLVLRVTLSLGLVLGVLWFCARRLGGRATPARSVPIDVLSRRSLGRRSGVAVVDVAGRRLLLGVGDTGVQLVADLGETPVAPAAPVARVAAGRPDDGARSGEPGFAAVLAAQEAAGDHGLVVGTGRLAGSVLDKATWARARQVLTGRVPTL